MKNVRGPLRNPQGARALSNYVPIAKYDSLTVEEIRGALGRANANTINRVREYERRYAKRDDVIEVIDRAAAHDSQFGLRAPDERFIRTAGIPQKLPQ